MRVRSRFDSKKIGELVCDGALKYVQNFAVEIDGERVAEYKSLDKVASEWEDYVPQEPLIIDKYPREAIRNWLYVVGGWDKARIKYYDTTNTYEFANETGYHIELKCVKLRPCDLAKTYTLDELCGEEE